MKNYDKLIFKVAYNILGLYEEAKDVVQDINIKRLEGKFMASRNEKAMIVRATVNHCINLKKRLQKVDYIGEWLPSPIINQFDKDAQDTLDTRDQLTYEMTYLLEKVNLKERAVFVLRNAFDMDYSEIAKILDLSTDNARQINNRVKKKLRHDQDDVRKPYSQGVELSRKFVESIGRGDVDRLMDLFREEVSLTGDGGGLVYAIKKPIHGSSRVAQFLINVAGMSNENMHSELGEVSGQPAVLIYEQKFCILVFILSVVNDRISAIYAVRNPTKLGHLAKDN